MKYARDRYLKFSAFAGQVVENVKSRLSNTGTAEQVGKVLYVIGNVLMLGGLYVFSAFYMLLMAGAIAYYGGIAALFAAHPILATIMLGLAGALGMSVFKLTKTLYEQREVFDVVKKEVLDPYEPRFTGLVSRNRATDTNIPEVHVRAVEMLATDAERALVAGLLARANLKPADFLKSAIPAFLKDVLE